MLHAGKVLTHRSLLRAVWGPEYGEEADYLRVYVRQLRLKVEQKPSQPCYILTEPGVGYVFQAQTRILQNTGAQWSEAGGPYFNPSPSDSSEEVSTLVSTSLLETETG